MDNRLHIIEGPIRLDAFAFLATIQLIVPDIDNPDTIRAFGSGFLLIHKDRTFFITADHVVHLDDHDNNNETGQRLKRDYVPQIITNVKVKNELASVNIPIGGFYHLTGFGFDRSDYNSNEEYLKTLDKILEGSVDVSDETLPINVRIADLPDFAISEIKQPFKIFPLSNLVAYDQNNIIVEEGTPKLFLSSDSITDFDSDRSYLVAGTVGNKLVNSVRLERINVIHDNLKLDSINKEGIAYLKSDESPYLDHWSGLSGAPLFNDEGLLSGMLIRGPEDCPYASAIPITKILHYIDLIIETETEKNLLR